jgi:hypothetical protein
MYFFIIYYYYCISVYIYKDLLIIIYHKNQLNETIKHITINQYTIFLLFHHFFDNQFKFK